MDECGKYIVRLLHQTRFENQQCRKNIECKVYDNYDNPMLFV
jgi:hypothetical protein